MNIRILAFLLLSPWFAYALPPVRIQGQVVSASGEPLELVHVRLRNSTIGTLSDFKGRFSFDVAPQDSVVIVFSALGYGKAQRVLIKPQKTVSLRVVMVSRIEALREVEVVSHRIQPHTMDQIRLKDLSLLPDATGGSVESLIAMLPGVNSSNELSSQYTVRGGNYDENLVYVNGVEVYRPQLVRAGEQEGLSFINPAMVGSLSFSAGGYDASYGDKMASVLAITYRKPEDFEGSVAASFLGASCSLGQATKRFSQLHGMRYKRNTSLLSSLDTKGEYRPSFLDYQAYLTYRLSKQWEISFLGNIAQNTYEFVPESRNTSFGTLEDAKQFTVYFDGREKDLFRTYFGALSLHYKGDGRSSLDVLVSGFITDEQESYDIQGQYWLGDLGADEADGLAVGSYLEHARNHLRASVASIALKGTTRFAHHHLSYGLQAQQERISDRVKEWEMRDSAGYSLPYTSSQGLDLAYSLRSSHEHTTPRFQAYVLDTYRRDFERGRLIAQFGVRASYWAFNQEFLCSPRFSLAYIPKAIPLLTTRLSAGVYYQVPFYKEYRDTIRDASDNLVLKMNQEIRSPRAIHAVLGGDYSFRAMGRSFKLTAEVYYKKLDDLIPYEVDNVRIRYYGGNIGEGYVAGCDIRLFGEFVPKTDSWLTFSLMQARETFYGVTVPRPTEQRYSIGLFFNDYVPLFPKYKMSLKAIWSDGLPTASPLGGRTRGVFRTPPYRRVDLGLSRVFQPSHDPFMRRRFWRNFDQLSIGLDAFNLLDIANTNSYFWVTSVENQQYAVPNYLTGRQLNFRMGVQF